jgi:hypothetical protein
MNQPDLVPRVQTATNAPRRRTAESIASIFRTHHEHSTISLCMLSLIAARQKRNVIEVYGIVRNIEAGSFIVESHYSDSTTPPHPKTDPDAACEHLFFGRGGHMLHTQLSSGEQWPATAPAGLGAYNSLRHRLSRVAAASPLPDAQEPQQFSTHPDVVNPLLQELLENRGHCIYNSVLQHLIETKGIITQPSLVIP